MNKSTPINQLPQQQNFQNGQYINEPQRQMITQAQQAAQNFTMPQSTQLGSEISPDTDSSIQDMLNELNGGGGGGGVGSGVGMPSQMSMNNNNMGSGMVGSMSESPHIMPSMMMHPQMMMQAPPTPNLMESSLLNDDGLSQQSVMFGASDDNSKNMEQDSSLTTWFINNNGNLKMVVILIVLFFAISIIPVESYVNRYISLQHIPYYNVIIKSVLFGIIYFIVTKIGLV